MDALTEIGVFVLSRAKREELATKLTEGGVTAADIMDVAAFVLESERDEAKARRYMVAVFADAARARDGVDGLRAYRKAQAAIRAKLVPQDDGPPHMANLPLGSATCPCTACEQKRAAAPQPEPWDHDRMCRVAWCRVQGDRQPIAVVARDLGVSETTLGVMLERGRTLSLSPAVEGKTRPTKRQIAEGLGYGPEDERRKAFREQMARARAGMAS